jgi:hypothetical protein
LVVLVSYIKGKIPYLIIEIISTAIRGIQISAGFRGVIFGMEDIIAIMRK